MDTNIMLNSSDSVHVIHMYAYSLESNILFFFTFFFYCSGFVINCNESAMDLHVFPIPIPPPTSLSTPYL